MNHCFKLVVVGNAGVGKTTFIKRHLTGEFEKAYNPTMGVDVHTLTLRTNHGQLVFNVWEVGGQGKYDENRKQYYQGANAVLVMADITSVSSKQATFSWLTEVRNVAGTIPAVICYNKNDIGHGKRSYGLMEGVYCELKIPQILISAKSNVDAPFLWLGQKLLNKNDLQFVPGPSVSCYPGEDHPRAADSQGETTKTQSDEGQALTTLLLRSMEGGHKTSDDRDAALVPIDVMAKILTKLLV